MTMAANNNTNWALKIETESRDQLIDVSSFIINAFETEFFYNPNAIPYILIPTSNSAGKSMIIEAVMKTLLDEYDPEDMKKSNAPKEMFIESEPGYASSYYCQAIGHTKGVPVIYGFDRVTWRYDIDAQYGIVGSFQRASDKHKIKPIGAIFSSNEDIGKTKPWLIINLYSGFFDFKWQRHLNIEICNEHLKSSKKFQTHWKTLQEFSKTKFLNKSPTPVAKLP